MPVITRPGEQPERYDPVLMQAYAYKDAAVAAAFQAIIDELDRFSRANLGEAVLGFDASRYQPLQRDARQVMSTLHRSLQHWSTTTPQ